MSFKDHFSECSDNYQAYRPDYPDELFRYIADAAPARQLAWDCATGTGQAAIQLTQYFDQVIASDGSRQQIEAAQAHEKVRYNVHRETNPDIQGQSLDLITVAQALHWFDHETFFNEVKRVLKPQGVLAVWCYNLLSVAPEIDQAINHFYFDVLGIYWPPERKHIENGYQDIVLPYSETVVTEFSIRKQWNLDTLIGYLRTWSAYKQCIKSLEPDPALNLTNQLKQYWDNPEQTKLVQWPITLKVCKKLD